MKYDLRSRSNGTKQDSPVQSKNTSELVKTISNKETVPKKDQQKKQPIKVSTPKLKEHQKYVNTFNMDIEMNNIKIPIPLVELTKN